MEDDSKPLTAFTVRPLGFYQCKCMPFGLTNVTATFQRLMENCLGDFNLNWCIIHLDDIIVFSKTPKENVEQLCGVFTKLASTGLKLKLSKCDFFKTKITYLGHVVSGDGIEIDPRKTEAVKNWPKPQTVTNVRAFLGFTNQYRKCIPNYAHIASPLNELISGENSKRKHMKVQWTYKCTEAFETLKELCCSTPILAYANYQKKFILHMDASDHRLGAVLYQMDDNDKKRVIAFVSRSLNPAEKNYPVHKLEFLALKWDVTSRFHEYLYGGEFEVYTDNNPLIYVLTTAKLDATGQIWIASLANYSFSLHYKTGKINIEADALSRISERVNVNTESVKAIMNAVMLNDFTELNEYPNLLVCKSARPTPQKFTNEQWIEFQKEDLIIGQFLPARKSKTRPEEILPEVRNMLKTKSRFVVHHNLLYQKCESTNHNRKFFQFVLPTVFRKQALEACHDKTGHLGVERKKALIKDQFYWSGMDNDITEYIKTCPRCLRFKAVPETAELNPITVT